MTTTELPYPCRNCQALCKCTEECSVAAAWKREQNSPRTPKEALIDLVDNPTTKWQGTPCIDLINNGLAKLSHDNPPVCSLTDKGRWCFRNLDPLDWLEHTEDI